MNADGMLIELLARVRTLETGVATANIRLEYQAASDTDQKLALKETQQRVTALERWRWTAAGVCIVAAMFAQPLIGLIHR